MFTTDCRRHRRAKPCRACARVGGVIYFGWLRGFNDTSWYHELLSWAKRQTHVILNFLFFSFQAPAAEGEVFGGLFSSWTGLFEYPVEMERNVAKTGWKHFK